MQTGHSFKNRVFLLSAVLFSLSACASTGFMPGFSGGEQKNSLPFMGKDMLEEVHSIAVAPFYGDNHKWKEAAYELFISSPKISVVQPEKVERIIREGKKDLSVIEPDDRMDFLSRIGRTLQSDAVLNGVILSSDKQNEIILQLVSSKDSRVLWWQAVEFRFKEGAISLSDQKALLTKMLDPLFPYLGKRTKTPSAPSVKSQSRIEEQPKTDTSPKTDIPSKTGTKSKTDKKPDKGTPPADISPM